MADDENYDALMASDDANYDDFMMSDEEGAEMIEMEEESDEQPEGTDNTGNNANDRVDDAALQDTYEMALSFADDHDFDRARQLLADISTRANDLVWQWKASTQVLKTWVSESHYNRCYEDDIMLDDFDALLTFLEENMRELDGIVLKKSLGDLLDELFPFMSREFLYATELTASPYTTMKMVRRVNALARLQTILDIDRPPWAEKLIDTVNFKKQTMAIWSERLQNGRISLKDLQGLEACCQATDLAAAVKDPDYTDRLNLILQCHIFCFMSSPCDVNVSQLSWFVDRLEQLSSNSLAIQQSLGLMLQLHTSKAILVLAADMKEDSAGDLPLVRHVNKLREHLWECLQHMEEVGGSKQEFSSVFEKFILSGFIFCNMILYRSERTKINPFDLEQIKIAQDSPCVTQLQAVYHNFVDSQLSGLYTSIQELTAVKDLLSGLIDNVYYLARLIKLWTQIAPVYSCIPLKDLQQMLRLHDNISFSRDELLTVLMRSIMKDTAKTFYKLDLTQDLVFFGDEYKTQLGVYSKESFTKDCVCKKGSNIDWANDVGIFQEPCGLKNLDTCAFFDKLQRSRDTIHSSPRAGFQPANMRYSDKYDELAKLAKDSLSRSR